jgi:hypothetical protein
MDIEQVNSVLVKAIMGLQGAELEAMAEAMAMAPDDLGWMNPGVAAPVGVAARSKGFPQGLVRRLLQMKRDAPGVQSVKKRRVGRRTMDLEVRLRGGGTIGMTVEPNLVSLAGGRGMVRTGGRSVPEVYSDVVAFVRRHARGV